jgi:hypothetical protein
MKSTNQVTNEFDTNLELLKIAYKVYYRELNIDTPIYSCNLGLIKTTSYSSKLESKNIRKQAKR